FSFPNLRTDTPVDQTVILFVTRELVDRGVDARQQTVDRPRFRPRGRIVDREFITERLWTGEREAFDELQAICGAAEISILVKISCFDNERGALPMAARV